MRRSFQNLVAGTVLVATASIGVIAPLEVKSTPYQGEDWAYVPEEQEPCLPQFSVDFQLPERVIVVDQRDSCPVSTQVYVKLANDRRELRLIAHQSQNFSGRWVTQVDPVAQGGVYRVMGVEYLNGQMAPPLDQRITIPGTQQEQSAPVFPQLVLPPTPRQEVSPERSQAQVLTLEPDSKILIGELIELLRWFKTNVPLLTGIMDRLEPLIRVIESIKTS